MKRAANLALGFTQQPYGPSDTFAKESTSGLSTAPVSSASRAGRQGKIHKWQSRG